MFYRKTERNYLYRKSDLFKKTIDRLFKEPVSFLEKEGSASRPEVLCVKKDGTLFPASLLASEVENASGRKIAKVILLSDLTEQKAMEERLFLTEKLALYSELMGGIAHQLNNPLIRWSTFSEMLLRQTENEDPQKELALDPPCREGVSEDYLQRPPTALKTLILPSPRRTSTGAKGFPEHSKRNSLAKN
jgi:hypothetical protein